MKLKKTQLHKLIEIGAKAATGFLPGPVSAAFNAVCDSVKESVLNKRAEKWKSDVIIRLEKLEANYESLICDPSFATALIKTSELAVKTESDEKRQLLANALVNTYSLKIGEDKTIIFLQLIEKYTILHIQIIKYFHDDYMNEKPFNNHMPPIMGLVRMRFSNIDSAYLNKVVKDLQNDYILEAFQYDSPVEIMHYRAKLLTKLGEDFFNYLMTTNSK